MTTYYRYNPLTRDPPDLAALRALQRLAATTQTVTVVTEVN